MRLMIFAITLALSACATEYQSYSLSGGYSDQMTGNNTATVLFVANAFTNATTARKFALRRAAELTLLNGYDYFLVESSEDFTTTQTLNTINCTTSLGNTTCNESEGGSWEKPRTQLDIRMFHGDVPNKTGYYDARYLAN